MPPPLMSEQMPLDPESLRNSRIDSSAVHFESRGSQTCCISLHTFPCDRIVIWLAKHPAASSVTNYSVTWESRFHSIYIQPSRDFFFPVLATWHLLCAVERDAAARRELVSALYPHAGGPARAHLRAVRQGGPQR